MKKKEGTEKFRYKVKITKGWKAWTLGIIGFLVFITIPVLAIYLLYAYGDSSNIARFIEIIDELI